MNPRTSTASSITKLDSESSGGGSGRRLCRPLNQTRKQDVLLLKTCLEHIKRKNRTVRGSSVWEAYAGSLMQLVNKALLGFLKKVRQRERKRSIEDNSFNEKGTDPVHRS